MILKFRQPDWVTLGRITLSRFFYASSEQVNKQQVKSELTVLEHTTLATETTNTQHCQQKP